MLPALAFVASRWRLWATTALVAAALTGVAWGKMQSGRAVRAEAARAAWQQQAEHLTGSIERLRSDYQRVLGTIAELEGRAMRRDRDANAVSDKLREIPNDETTALPARVLDALRMLDDLAREP